MMLAYNHADYVGQALEGVLNQNVNFPFEIVVGEDCSQDETRSILMEYQLRHPEVVRVITYDENVGMNQNFRTVAEACRGEFVAICEADDYWTSNEKLSRQLRIAESRPELSLIVHNAMVEPFNGRRYVLKNMKSDCEFNVRDVLSSTGQFAATASYFVRREVLSSLPVWIDDAPVIDFFIEAYSQLVGRGYYMHDVMSIYRIGQPGGWTKNVLQQRTKAAVFKKRMIDCYDEMLEDFPEGAHLIRARSQEAVRDILFSSALCGQADYRSVVESKLTERLPAWELRIAHFGSGLYLHWHRIRSRAVWLWSRFGWRRG